MLTLLPRGDFGIGSLIAHLVGQLCSLLEYSDFCEVSFFLVPVDFPTSSFRSLHSDAGLERVKTSRGGVYKEGGPGAPAPEENRPQRRVCKEHYVKISGWLEFTLWWLSIY